MLAREANRREVIKLVSFEKLKAGGVGVDITAVEWQGLLFAVIKSG